MSIETISAKDMETYIGRKDILIVDLRCEEEFCKGHIRGAINIPYDYFFDNLNILNGFGAVVLYCERGSLSLRASRELDMKNTQIINLYGGYHAYTRYKH